MKNFFKSFAARKEAVILTYHSVNSTPLPFNVSHHIDEKRFEQHMRYLSNECHCISLDDLLSEVKEKNNKLRTVAITFDDGFANNYSTAFPILKYFNIPATIFLPTNYIDSNTLMWPETIALSIHMTKKSKLFLNNAWYPIGNLEEKANTYKAITVYFKKHDSDFIANNVADLLEQADLTLSDLQKSPYFDDFRILNWQQVNELAESNLVSFGSHTINHKRLRQVNDVEAIYEITESKKILENKLGNIDYFAYPYGGPDTDYSEQHKKMAKNAGYKAVATCIEGTVTNSTDLFELPRVSISSDCCAHRLAFLLNGGIAFQDGFSIKRLIHGLISGRASLATR